MPTNTTIPISANIIPDLADTWRLLFTSVLNFLKLVYFWLGLGAEIILGLLLFIAVLGAPILFAWVIWKGRMGAAAYVELANGTRGRPKGKADLEAQRMTMQGSMLSLAMHVPGTDIPTLATDTSATSSQGTLTLATDVAVTSTPVTDAPATNAPATNIQHTRPSEEIFDADAERSEMVFTPASGDSEGSDLQGEGEGKWNAEEEMRALETDDPMQW